MGTLEPPNESSSKRPTRLLAVIGGGLILCSGVCFFSMLAVPLSSWSNATKGIVAGVLFVGVQACWWIGVTLIGPAAIRGLRQRVGRWRGKASNDESEPSNDD